MDLTAWLDYQQRVHPRAIELGLERVREVWRRLGSPRPAPVTITVGGTNGKGSTVAFLEAMLRADQRRVGAYTSPHLLRYNERVRIDGEDARDEALVAAFERIERARGDIGLTYFEFGTLAALLLFADANVDVALLEVGLGGRLDAVNIVDADAAIVTTVDLDHQDWLGDDIDSIGREKAGIFRPGRPAIVGDPVAPRGLIEEGERIAAALVLAGRDYSVRSRGEASWTWSDGRTTLVLPEPALRAPCQPSNAGAAIAALGALRGRLGWNVQAITTGIGQARVGARLQRFGGEIELLIDVAHNPQAARALAAWLSLNPADGTTIAVFGALADKDVRGIVAVLDEEVSEFVLAGLDRDSPRGLAAVALRREVDSVIAADRIVAAHEDVEGALSAAFARARPGDRVLAFGSFFVAAEALRFASARALQAA